MTAATRPSLHVEPLGLSGMLRHYLRDLVYGANDGIVTTFAVVTGVAGGALPPVVVLVVGVANLVADGVSMGVSNLQAIRANEQVRAAEDLPEEEAHPWKHGLATLLAFVAAGSIPLLPYVLPISSTARLSASVAVTMAGFFAIGAARSGVTRERWWRAGLETLTLGALVAVAAYAAGAFVHGFAGAQD